MMCVRRRERLKKYARGSTDALKLDACTYFLGGTGIC